MFDAGVNAVISIDTDAEIIRFYTDSMNRRQVQMEVSYSGRPFSEEFYQKLDQALKSYQQKSRAMGTPKVSIVLPDHLFLMDTINVPTIGKKAMENAVEVGIGAIYKNKRDLHYRWFPLSQTKQFATFGLVGTRKEVLDKLQDICNANQVNLQIVSFAANAMACGAMTFNPKLRNGTGLVLDVQENACRFAFVNKGRVIGAYHLPFGTQMLSDTKVVSEDALFDHSSGEALVRIARDEAKVKTLTGLSGESIGVLDSEEALASGSKKTIKKATKPRTREVPTEPRGFMYENFRIILKWTLNLLENNPTILAQGDIDAVYMNIDSQYNFIFDMLREEEKESGVSFTPVFTGNRQSAAENDLRMLELFGGLQLKQYGKFNNF